MPHSAGILFFCLRQGFRFVRGSGFLSICPKGYGFPTSLVHCTRNYGAPWLSSEGAYSCEFVRVTESQIFLQYSKVDHSSLFLKDWAPPVAPLQCVSFLKVLLL